MIQRFIEPQLQLLTAQFPVITITGPRQSGKTTLAQHYFKDHDYVNLEDPEVRAYASEDPKGFLADHPDPLIIDEVQRVPGLLSYIQVLSDRNRKSGQYVLTGSHQPKLQSEISQSLAGRTGILQLLPLSMAELAAANHTLDRDALIHRGFLPKLYALPAAKAELEYSNYFATYVERDVKLLINLHHQHEFEVFVRLLAGRVGQLLNLNSLSDDIGVSAKTLKEWLNILEASFIIFRLPPYFENFGKRLVKTPKIYFTEVGLAAWLIGIKSADMVSRDPLIGNLFENMVIVEALKSRLNAGNTPDMYFFRDQRGFEIDMLIAANRKLYPYEIKSARTWSTDFANNLKSFVGRDSKIEPGTVIYAGDLKRSGNPAVINFADTHQTIPQ
ncbi:MAG: ATP-binding protein [Lentisphaeria bacterium]|nr:ATP-binding protein [Lentisphaeria bacterium]